MSIRYRILLAMAAFSAVATSYFLVWRHHMDEGMRRIEHDAYTEQQALSQRIVDLDGQSLATVAFDYTYWNDMVKMAIKPNTAWAKQNLDTCLSTYSLNALWVLNRAGRIQYSIKKPESNGMPIPVDLRPLLASLDQHHFVHGFTNLGGKLVEIRAASIHKETDPKRDGPWYGYFIVAREWDAEKLKHVGQLMDCDLDLVPIGQAVSSNNARAGEIETSITAKSIFGIPVAHLRFRGTRPALAHARMVGSTAPRYIVISCLALVLMTSVFTIAWVLVPLGALSKALRTGNLQYLDNQLKRKGEFGEVARLTHQSFTQKIELEDARQLAEEKNGELIAQAASLEEARDQALDAFRAKSAFVATVSHEIRTPMNGILGMAALMEGSHLDETDRERLGIIQQSGEALLNVINDVLDLAKLEAGRIELERVEFDLSQVVNEVCALLASQADQKGLRLVNAFDPDLATTYLGDPSRIRQILVNLVGNALKFTERGEVAISVDVLAGSELKDTVQVKVKDTGIGIPIDRQPAIFDSFSQVDDRTSRLYGGTGLGLALCQQFAGLMGSRVCVESEVDQGSSFWFDLTIERVAVASVKRGDSNGPLEVHKPQSGLRILLAEDNSINERVARSMLERLGCKVETAIHGQMAVEAWRCRPFDLILMDMNMPVMDGVEAIQMIRAEEEGVRVPILALTANVDEAARSACVTAGASGFLPKPISISKLSDALYEYCSDDVRKAA